MENSWTPFVSHVAHWSTDFEVFELDSETCFEAMELHSGIPSLLFPGRYLTCRSCMSPCVENPKRMRKGSNSAEWCEMIWFYLNSKQFFGYFGWSSHFIWESCRLSCQQLASPTVWRFHELSSSEGQVFSAKIGWKDHWDWLRNHLKSLEIPKFLQWSRA